MFVLDVSGSVQHERFVMVTDFLVNITKELETWGGKVRIGLVSFSDEAEFGFALNRYSRQDDIHEAIRLIR